MLAFRSLLAAAAAALTLAAPAVAQDHPEHIHVHDAYALIGPASGAVFFLIHNNTENDIRIVGARSELAKKAELHSHTEDANGVMKMGKIEGGVPLAAGEMHAFERGGDHVMLMGLTTDLKDGDMIPLTLIFEDGAEIQLDVPVDNARTPDQATGHSDHDMDHSGMSD
ncbi:copper chaperone PCu(A)C [Tabrizicola sp. BL-A-41-H6]|uniref:copper chaperone PCu(A)C n=1 Tax=Tabrizicola sp. BL-A-41-H6 TaxID=3421107 RepID=UPI003D66C9FB